MKANTLSTSIVTVTYGSRQNLLRNLLEYVKENEQVSNIVIVSNGSNLEELKLIYNNDKFIFVDLAENTGSANAYQIGIEKAKTLPSDYVYLLDDDNTPSRESLDELFHFYNILSAKTKNIALLSLREDRKDFLNVSKGNKPSKEFKLGNSFLGWHLKDIPIKIFRKLKGNKIKDIHSIPYAEVPIAPYGGLFLRKEMLDKSRLPNSEYYLYCDDYDFTYGLRKDLGARIYLIPSSKVIDMDESWFVKSKDGFVKSFLTSNNDIRIYYSVRNRVYFEKKDLVTNLPVYYINRFSLMLILSILSKVLRKKERYELLKEAINHGDNEILGKNELYVY
ncbi:glycosyltransferase family 2 protein [Terribacillus sp. JSM ZJ617]|uniref:glycosyltransferase family 2 protein n=1 Tax=Terribacillus sp. JSM ZJ617 TaxID=3342119 RepID=UPI0035A877C4